MKERDYYVTPKSNTIMRFLWKAAGGDRYLLERATYSDQVKYLCLGGIVLATGAMAGLAGGYAFYTIFAPKAADVLDKTKMVGQAANYIPSDLHTVILSVVFGVIWGLIIFNIDRFIVTSTGKGDGTEAITWDEFKGAIPRLIMGTIIALTISKPVEIRMFKTEIDLAISQQQDKEKAKGIEQANENFDRKVKEAKDKLSNLNQEIAKKDSMLMVVNDKYLIELTGPRRGNGPIAQALLQQKNALEAQITELKSRTEYQDVQKAIKEFEFEQKQDIANAEQKAATLDGLLIRIQKAHEIAGTTISLFITLLFLAIELTPVFFKLMLVKTPYDYLAENRDEMIRAENGIEVRYDYYKDKKGLERHLIINHEAHRLAHEKIKLSEIQQELTDYAVEQYKLREKQHIDNNLDDYIQKLAPDETISA